MYDNRRSFAPVSEGEELDVKIEAVGEKGDGIAKKDGFVLFVPNTHEGDEVRIRVTKVLRKVGFGEVVGSSGKGAKAKPAPAEEEAEPAPEDSENFGEESSSEESDEPVAEDSEELEKELDEALDESEDK